MSGPHQPSGELSSTSLEYLNYLEFCTDLSILSFLYSVIDLKLFTHVLFYTLVYHPITVYLVTQIVPAWATGSFFLLAPMSIWHTPFIYSTRCSRLNLYIYWLSPKISHFSKENFGEISHWKMVVKTKIWLLGVFTATGVSLLLGHLSWQSKELHVV